mgnify:CR=1 FL=1|tara:strand:- start:1904 stop:2095 length:192 start_codon:yes stop_codon:yes gene_type:complete
MEYSSVKSIVRGSYEELLNHYYKKGIGKRSEISGVIITDKLVKTIEKRYQEIGGVLPLRKRKG